MNYLFFDTECANCFDHKGKIYSFGYVLCDEQFKVIDQKDILIDPKVEKWDFYVLKHMLAYPKTDVYASPDFSVFADTIFSMLCDKNNLIFGFALANDIKFLSDEAARYSLNAPVFHYYDVQTMLKLIEKSKMPKSLERAYSEYCGEEAAKLHRSDYDALNTMRLLKSLCERKGLSPIEYATELNYSGADTTQTPKTRKNKQKS